MMNYEIFKEVVKEKFMDYMPEKFKGMELVAEPVEKVNVTLDGIILHISMCLSCLEKVRLIRSQVERQRADREAHQGIMMC